MKTLSTALAAHYAQSGTTLAKCWLCTQKSGVQIGFTSLDQDIVFDGITYQSAGSYSASNNTTSDKMNVDNMEVNGFLQYITDADIAAGVWDYCKIDLFEVNYRDLTMGKNDLRSGFLGIVNTGMNTFKVELRGLMQAFQQAIGRVYLGLCDANLGDARCGVVLTPFTFTGSVSTVTDGRTFTTTLNKYTGYFLNGLITFDTGANAGISMEIRSHTSPGALTLQLLMPHPISVGDTFTAIAGCPKTIAACSVRFNNSNRNRSFFLIPGRDRLLSGK